MQIVSQSATLAHSLLRPPRLALPAPKIAGLLPARVGADPCVSPPTPFVYSAPSLAALPQPVRTRFDALARMLLDATVALLADERSEAEFDLAANAFRQQVTTLYHTSILGDPKPPVTSPFAAHRQRLAETVERLADESKRHLAETNARLDRELAAIHAHYAREDVP
jgi:hypothetical protein